MLHPYTPILAAFLAAGMHTAAFAQASNVLPCHENARKCATELRAQSPVKKMSYWVSAFKKPVEQRVGIAADELVAYLNFDNIAGGISNKPHATPVPEDFLKDVKDAITELPPRIQKLISKKLAGIYFVKDLGGTGYTDYIDNGKFGPSAGFVVLDIDVLLKNSANAWATWKERTPFIPDPGYRLDAVIETGTQDNRKNAIQYILLHELGHVLAIGGIFHPLWGQSSGKAPLDGYPFAQLSWQYGVSDDFEYLSKFETQFPLRKNIAYYFGAKLNSNQMAMTYDQLEETSFPTLYAATNPSDDFAESFASYVHTVMLKRPLEIHIYRDGSNIKTSKPCWGEPRCAAKQRLLEDLLGVR